MVVCPLSSVSTSVLRVSGHPSPHDSVDTSRSGGTTSRYVPVMVISIAGPFTAFHPNRNFPPGRRSISHVCMTHAPGPMSQCGRCVGFVYASNTIRRGASTTRVTSISRSDGVVNDVVCRAASVFFAVTMTLLLCLHVLEIRVQSLVALVPELPIALGPLRHFLEWR